MIKLINNNKMVHKTIASEINQTNQTKCQFISLDRVQKLHDTNNVFHKIGFIPRAITSSYIYLWFGSLITL